MYLTRSNSVAIPDGRAPMTYLLTAEALFAWRRARICSRAYRGELDMAFIMRLASAAARHRTQERLDDEAAMQCANAFHDD